MIPQVEASRRYAQAMGRFKHKLNILPRTLWWSRTDDGFRLEVRYGIRHIESRTATDVNEARELFRELVRRHKTQEVREMAAPRDGRALHQKSDLHLKSAACT